MSPYELVLDRLERVVRKGKQANARCVGPGHHDHKKSLSISVGEQGQTLLHCHAGCDVLDVLKGLGLTMLELWPQSEARDSGEVADSAAWARAEDSTVHFACSDAYYLPSRAYFAPVKRDTKSEILGGFWAGSFPFAAQSKGRVPSSFPAPKAREGVWSTLRASRWAPTCPPRATQRRRMARKHSNERAREGHKPGSAEQLARELRNAWQNNKSPTKPTPQTRLKRKRK